MALYMQYYKTSTFKVTLKSKVALSLLSVTTSLLFCTSSNFAAIANDNDPINSQRTKSSPVYERLESILRVYLSTLRYMSQKGRKRIFATSILW